MSTLNEVEVPAAVPDVSGGRVPAAAMAGTLTWDSAYLMEVHNLSPDCIKIVDHDGHLLSMNPNGQAAMQIDDFSTCQGSDWLGFWQGEDRAAMLGAFAQARQGRPAHFSGYCPTMKGEPRWWDVTLAPLPDPARPDTTPTLLIVSRDVTERVLAQRRLEELNATLDAEVQRQTEHLRRERQLLLQTNEELENITYAMSHDLLTPVRHLLSFARLARRLPADDTVKRERYLQIIEDSASNLGRMIEGVLHFSRAGRLELRPRPVDLNTLLREVQRDLHAEQPDHVVTWHAPDLPTVQADARALRSILKVLCANALKFTRTTPDPTVQISAHRTPGSWRIDVTDNGAGFDPEYSHKLFQLFQRLHHQNEYEGAGTGLAFVRRLVSRHGGTVCASGQKGVGATFSFTLPDTPPTD
ncbi:sensor histidine kinase [Deinococcus knuensis]|uniref:sensor histidine kinase n=1 Tax=Deinococcus knuensis TaxID=1837380 RepID=UPI001662A773|nr:ATP-binding protein [Deinococcus knuensis]